MKQFKLSRISVLFLSLLLSCVLLSCDKKEKELEIRNLYIGNSSYSVGVKASNYIPIYSGNKNYTLTPGDASIFKAEYRPATGSYDRTGDICIEGSKKGTTTLTVKDNVSGETAVLDITVTRKYLNLYMNYAFPSIDMEDKVDKNKLSLEVKGDILHTKDYVVTLLANEGDNLENKAYLFNSPKEAQTGEILLAGNYQFERKGDDYWLYLSFKDGDKTISHKFNIFRGEYIFPSLVSYLNVASGEKETDYISEEIRLLEDLTDKYKSDYPELKNISLTVKMYASARNWDIATDLIK